MSAYNTILYLCEKSGIAVTALEKELGFGRGSIGKLKNGGSMSSSRLQKIADYFGVSLDYLMNGVEPSSGYYLNDETAKMAQEMYEDPDMRSLFDMKRNMDPDRFKAHVNFMKELYKKEHPDD